MLNTPEEILSKLANSGRNHVITAIIGNSKLSWKILREIYRKYGKDDQIRQTFLSRNDTPDDIIDDCVNTRNFFIQGQGIQHPNVKKETLERLLKDPDPVTRNHAKKRLRDFR